MPLGILVFEDTGISYSFDGRRTIYLSYMRYSFVIFFPATPW